MGPSPAEVAKIARATGCRVIIDQPLEDGTVAQHIECESHKAKVRLLAALADFDARDPAQVAELRTLAEGIFAGRPLTPRQRAAELLSYTQQNVRQTEETVETFTPAWRTYKARAGDCDDQSRALAALMQVSGLRTSMGTLGDPPTHVAPKVWIDGAWLWADSSVPGSRLGEHPRAAVKRLGIKRPDVGGLAAAGDAPGRAFASDVLALAQLGLAAYFVETGESIYWKAGALAAGAQHLVRPKGAGEDGAAEDFDAADAANFAFAPVVLSRQGAHPAAYPAAAAAQYIAFKSRYGALGLWAVTVAVVGLSEMGE